eukprot:gene57639-biopygen2210
MHAAKVLAPKWRRFPCQQQLDTGAWANHGRRRGWLGTVVPLFATLSAVAAAVAVGDALKSPVDEWREVGQIAALGALGSCFFCLWGAHGQLFIRGGGIQRPSSPVCGCACTSVSLAPYTAMRCYRLRRRCPPAAVLVHRE